MEIVGFGQAIAFAPPSNKSNLTSVDLAASLLLSPIRIDRYNRDSAEFNVIEIPRRPFATHRSIRQALALCRGLADVRDLKESFQRAAPSFAGGLRVSVAGPEEVARIAARERTKCRGNVGRNRHENRNAGLGTVQEELVVAIILTSCLKASLALNASVPALLKGQRSRSSKAVHKSEADILTALEGHRRMMDAQVQCGNRLCKAIRAPLHRPRFPLRGSLWPCYHPLPANPSRELLFTTR
jgi:hypothetical protein